MVVIFTCGGMVADVAAQALSQAPGAATGPSESDLNGARSGVAIAEAAQPGLAPLDPHQPAAVSADANSSSAEQSVQSEITCSTSHASELGVITNAMTDRLFDAGGTAGVGGPDHPPPQQPPTPTFTHEPASAALDTSTLAAPEAPGTPAAAIPAPHLADVVPLSTMTSAAVLRTDTAQPPASYPSAASALGNTYAARMLQDASAISASMRGGTGLLSSSTRRGRSRTRGRAVGEDTFESALSLQAGSPRCDIPCFGAATLKPLEILWIIA